MVGCLIREMDLRPPFESNDNIINSNLDQSSKNIIILLKIFVLFSPVAILLHLGSVEKLALFGNLCIDLIG